MFDAACAADFHAEISTDDNDTVAYADSRILDRQHLQVVYEPNMTQRTTPPLPSQKPMFYGTLDNSWGKVLLDYVEKIFKLGFNGVCEWQTMHCIISALAPLVVARCQWTCLGMFDAACASDHGEGTTKATYTCAYHTTMQRALACFS